MKKRSVIRSVSVFFLTAVCVMPFLYVLACSMLQDGGFTLRGFYQVLLGQTEYITRFYRSVAVSLCIAVAHLAISSLAGYAFARYRFPGKNLLFFLMMILMILPMQVTLMPNYIVLEELGLLNSVWGLILPAVFAPLGAVIMTQSIRAFPVSVIEAARLDGCGPVRTLVRVVLPGCPSGMVCTFLLAFLEGWNMVEQPLTYLSDFEKYPISVALISSTPANPTVLLACCVLVTLPALFLFLYFNREIAKGIAMGGER